MATTTYSAIRDDQIAAIVAITPTSHSDVKFLVSLDEGDFREWAEKFPNACFRRFTVRYLSEDEPPNSNLDVEFRTVYAEIIVAYPTDRRYGSENARDLSDVMRQDGISLNNAAGLRGYGNLGPDATVTNAKPEHETGSGVSFLVMPYTVRYWEAVS